MQRIKQKTLFMRVVLDISNATRGLFATALAAGALMQCSRIRILSFFQISKKHNFLRFFLNDLSKNVKGR